MADEKHGGTQEEYTEIKRLHLTRRIWCIIGIVVGLLSLGAVIFGIVWYVERTSFKQGRSYASKALLGTHVIQLRRTELTNPLDRAITRKKYSESTPSKTNHVSPYANMTKLLAYDSNSPVATKPRVFVIGDIHGCLDEFNQLLTAINYTSATDQIIIAGDLTAKGPDSIGVIRRAQQIGALCVRGNHDDKVIRYRTFQNVNGAAAMTGTSIMDEGSVPDPMKFGNQHQKIATNMTDTDYAYLQSCPVIMDIPSFHTYIVHGGADPTIANMTNQDAYSVMNVRDINSEGVLVASSKIGGPWYDEWNKAQVNSASPKYIVYGHAAGRGLNLQTYTSGIDTGCVYGRQLTALEMHSHAITQVNCKQYAK